MVYVPNMWHDREDSKIACCFEQEIMTKRAIFIKLCYLQMVQPVFYKKMPEICQICGICQTPKSTCQAFKNMPNLCFLAGNMPTWQPWLGAGGGGGWHHMTLNLDWDAASFSSSNLTRKPYAIFLEGRANESHENQRLGASFFLGYVQWKWITLSIRRKK